MSLELKGVTKKYGDKVVIDNFSYKFEDKGLYLIRGDSGVGKTTLLRMISGLDDCYSGNIIGAGIGRVVVSFQEYRLFPTLSAIDNVVKVLADKESDQKAQKAEAALSYLNFEKSDFHKFPAELSGGMKQRISIVRAVTSDKPILLLDEPLKELDDELVGKVISLLKAEAEKRLVIVVSHAYFEHFEKDKVIVL